LMGLAIVVMMAMSLLVQPQDVPATPSDLLKFANSAVEGFTKLQALLQGDDKGSDDISEKLDIFKQFEETLGFAGSLVGLIFSIFTKGPD
jgi:hypothetical protein